MLNVYEVKDIINGSIFTSKFRNIDNPILEYKGSDLQLISKNYEIEMNYCNGIDVFIFFERVEDSGNKTEIHICTSHNSNIFSENNVCMFDDYKAVYNPFIKKWYIFHYENDIQTVDDVIGNKKIKHILNTLLEISENTVKEEYKVGISSILPF